MRASDRIILAASDNDTPVFNLQAFDDIGNGHHSALFSTTARSRNFGFDDYAKVVEDTFKGSMTLAANSLFRSGGTNFMRGILSPQTESKKFEEANLKIEGFTPIRGNLFEDAQHALWKVIGDGDDKQLVRVSQENFGALLEARRKSMPLLAADEIMTVNPKFGDYTYYFNPVLEAFDFGIYGTNGKKPFVVSRKHKKAFTVKDSQILEAATPAPELRQEMRKSWSQITASSGSFADYLTFIGMLYGKNSEYYKANERAIMEAEGRIS